jgi:hypothetical protein
MSKIKKRGQKGHSKKGMKSLNPMAAMISELTTKESAAFDSAARVIAELFRKYSLLDLATSLFVSTMWLPNIASPVKHQFFILLLASLRPRDFAVSNRITSYANFKEFLEELYRLAPSFSMLEDYVPEPDWGTVKFHHEGLNYKIFYGSELENVYGYLETFQIIHDSLEKEYLAHAGRSPKRDLHCCLQLQDEIISGIGSQRIEKDFQVSPGHLEIPPRTFWQDVSVFYINYTPELGVGKAFADSFSFRLGNLPNDVFNYHLFVEMVFTGKLLPVFFITDGARYFPILPRRYSSILFDAWSEMHENHRNKVIPDGSSYSLEVRGKVYRYIAERVTKGNLFPFASALTKKGLPHEIVFTAALVSKDRLILVYVTSPFHSNQKIEEELARTTPKLQEALELASKPPVTLGLHISRQNVQFHSKTDGESLKPILWVVIPQVSTDIKSFTIPQSLPGQVMFLDQFLGMVDELDEVHELASFVDYLAEYERFLSPLATALDKFASFKDSYGVLVEGAMKPDLIGLDPHWGSTRRYKSLEKFWEVYPEVDFFGTPRSWKVMKESATRTRLEARGFFGVALYSQVGSTHFFINAPFHEMSFKQGQIANLLIECLEDSMSRNQAILEKHQFFGTYFQLQVLLFPLSLVSEDQKFSHLRHLIPTGNCYSSDYGLLKPGLHGIRIVFDDNSLIEAFSTTKDRSVEIELLCELLMRLNEIAPDDNIGSIREALEKTKSGPPRFKMFQARKPASFPELVQIHEPKPGHFKMARKRVAELAKQQDLSEGFYTLDDAKAKLNLLRNSLVAEIDSEVSKFNFMNAIPYLLARIDALSDRYERTRLVSRRSVEHEVDYAPEEPLAKQHSEYTRMHRNFRYLIEKFVQLQSRGDVALKTEHFQYLVALVDWLHVFYDASDSLHYELHAAGMRIDRDYLVEVDYEGDLATKIETFKKEQARQQLSLIGNPDDRVSSPRPSDDLLGELDQAFIQDLGFGFQGKINTLQVLTHWSDYRPDFEESPYYSARANEIAETCSQNIIGIKRDEINLILDFLTLKSDDVIRIHDQVEPCQDLPVWEHRKRYARYALRPLILIKDKYYWGPYSTMNAGIRWSGALSSGTLPTDLKSPAIQRVLRKEKKLIEDALVDKTTEIVERYTPYVEKNCRLHKRDPTGGHPRDLGDFDVLAFCPDANVVLNIECKDILEVFCPKDAKRLREQIFGRYVGGKSYLDKINKRQSYLLAHLTDIASALNWPIDLNKAPRIVPIYLSRTSYWWTLFPPVEVDVVFLRIELLGEFIESL